MDDIDEEIREHTMADTFGGYDWADPIRPWYRPARIDRTFSDRELEIAEQALATRRAS